MVTAWEARLAKDVSVEPSSLLSEELSGTGLESGNSMTPQLGIETSQLLGATPEGP